MLFLSLDPTTYKLFQNSIKIKKVDPVQFGPIQCSCCYDYSMKSIDLAKVKDVEVMSVSADDLSQSFVISRTLEAGASRLDL